jgi:creatinine amidohydrolase
VSGWLADLSRAEIARRAADGAILAVPLGSTEQHGPHLPVSTDSDIAVALCRGLAAARDDVVIAPAINYGSSGEHAGFAGTISIGQYAVEVLLTEFGRSATETFTRIVFVNGHGGNTEAATRAVGVLRAESRDVLLHLPRWDGDPHAGHAETSLMLHLDPARVALSEAVVGDLRPLRETWAVLSTQGVRAVSPSGVLGDPTTATAAAGASLLGELTVRLVEQVRHWRGR